MRILFDCPAPLLTAIGAAILLAVVLLLAARDARQFDRAVLKPLYLAAVAIGGLMVAGLLLSPRFLRSWEDPVRPRVVVLADASRSMDFTDADAASGEPVPRREIAARLLAADAPWLAALSQRFEVAAFSFSGPERDPAPLPLGGYELDEEGYSTALGDALSAAETLGGSDARPRAVVLVADGASNAGRDPVQAAASLGRAGVPVFVVGVGDPDPPKRLELVEFTGPADVLLGDEAVFEARIASSGLGARKIPVELLLEGEVVDRREIVLPPGGASAPVRLAVVPARPGRYLFSARVGGPPPAEAPGERSRTTTVTVEERRIRILLIDSTPRWQFRFLRNAFERDPAVELTVTLLRPGVGPLHGPGYRPELPVKPEDLADFDLVALGELPGDGDHEQFLKRLADAVITEGRALVVLADRAGSYRRLAGTPVEPLLPVTLRDVAPSPARDLFRPEPTELGREHLVTRLAPPGDENAALWVSLPPLRWAAPVGGLAPGAESLLVHPARLAGTDRLPLLAVHRAGRGKTMFVGLDETWRWRKGVGDEHFYRFWAQAIRYLIRRPFQEGDERARLSVDRPRAEIGEAVVVEAYCRSPDGFPLTDAVVRLVVESPDGTTEELSMVPAGAGYGLYRAEFTPRRAGEHRLRPRVSIYGDEPLESTAVVEALRADRERDFLGQDRATLAAIAEASGGRYVDSSAVGELQEPLAARAETRRLVAEFAPTRHFLYFGAMALLFAGAWLIRKRSGLA